RNSGEPKRIQSADTRGLHPRTFTLDSSASVLVAANQMSLAVREADRVRTVPASLTVFRIATDGTLSYVRKYDVETDAGRSLGGGPAVVEGC
ncbi:MAG TPA: beta-propeller fold lactonase family protein, partial [Terriglobales bacterium]|nr:beta-propeller fold lactonase family protein [Terriglobales bacterium]